MSKSELEQFFMKTKETHQKEIRALQDLQIVLDALNQKNKATYVRYEVISNT